MHMTYENFDSREEFVRHLNLYHYDRDLKQQEFISKPAAVSGFAEELAMVKADLETIKTTWNNQSIDQIEQTVTKQGPQQLNIMQGQKNDKLRAGYQPSAPMYRVKNCSESSVFYQLGKTIGLEYATARYHVQFPGETTVFHTDIFSPTHEFLPANLQSVSDKEIGQDKGLRRVLVALEDWEWGQVMMFGAQTWAQWKAGDLIYWNYGVPHCAANMGYHPRISVSITGLATDKFFKWITHGN
jgi:hypothetical protein